MWFYVPIGTDWCMIFVLGLIIDEGFPKMINYKIRKLDFEFRFHM